MSLDYEELESKCQMLEAELNALKRLLQERMPDSNGYTCARCSHVADSQPGKIEATAGKKKPLPFNPD